MKHYYRIMNAARRLAYGSLAGLAGSETISEAEFLAAVGDRPKDFDVGLSELLPNAIFADAERALSERFRSDVPLGAITYWWLNEETGKGEGWKAPPLRSSAESE